MIFIVLYEAVIVTIFTLYHIVFWSHCGFALSINALKQNFSCIPLSLVNKPETCKLYVTYSPQTRSARRKKNMVWSKIYKRKKIYSEFGFTTVI